MFLARQPAKIATKDLLRGKRFPRTDWAAGIALTLLLLAGITLTAVIPFRGPLLLPLGALLALAAAQFAFDVLGRGRSLLPELFGAAAAAMFTPLITLAGGLAKELAWLLGLVLALQAWLAIVYVSTRLKRVQGAVATAALALLGVTLAAGIVLAGLMRWPLLLLFATLAVRALWGTSQWSVTRRPQVVGMQEVAYASGVLVGIGFSI